MVTESITQNVFQMHDISLKHSLKGRVKKGEEKLAFLFKGSLDFI